MHSRLHHSDSGEVPCTSLTADSSLELLFELARLLGWISTKDFFFSFPFSYLPYLVLSFSQPVSTNELYILLKLSIVYEQLKEFNKTVFLHLLLPLFLLVVFHGFYCKFGMMQP